MRRHRYSSLIVALLVALLRGDSGAVSPPDSGGEYAAGDLVVTGTIVTMDDRLGVLSGGRVVVSGGRILAVLEAGAPLPDAARTFPAVEIDGFVFPGLVNAHNHLVYGALPPWQVPLLGGRPLRSVRDWRSGALLEAYLEHVNRPKRKLIELGLTAEMGKWAELKELAAGTTTTQGSFGFRGHDGHEDRAGFARYLARNVELEQNGLRQSSGGIYAEGREVDVVYLAEVLESVGSRPDGVFLVHLSEGTTEAERQELYDLNNVGRRGGERCGPLLERAAVIHGTSYGGREFRLMTACGADLVASSLSNLLYYGRAPDLAAAVAAGVNVSLGTDWAPVGSRNLLEELKVADFLHGDRLSDRQLVELVTVNPAKALRVDDRIGRLAPGLVGDLLALRSRVRDPYGALVEATEREVALVAVGGEPLFGDVELMRALKPGDHEVVESGCGFAKAVDVRTSRDEVAEGGQGIVAVRDALADALGREPSPLFTCADRAHLDALARSRALAYFHPQLARLPGHLRARYR